MTNFSHMTRVRWAIGLGLILGAGSVVAEPTAKSADEVAKELSNPAGSLASLAFNLQYQNYKGDLPGADDQDTWSMLFQPVLPFPVGDKGRRIIFRPEFPVLFDQPVFDTGKGDFKDSDLSLGDIVFDLVYAGTKMRTKKDGFLWGVGAAGTLPTATDRTWPASSGASGRSCSAASCASGASSACWSIISGTSVAGTIPVTM